MLSETVARTFFTDNPEELCKCEVCSAISSGLHETDSTKEIAAFFDQMDFMRMRAHFMAVHAKERQELAATNLGDIVQQLKTNIERCHNLKAQFYNVSDEHLRKWLDVLITRLERVA
jgi:hypothetical protein